MGRPNITVKEEKSPAKENGVDGLIFNLHHIFIIVVVVVVTTPFPPAPFLK